MPDSSAGSPHCRGRAGPACAGLGWAGPGSAGLGSPGSRCRAQPPPRRVTPAAIRRARPGKTLHATTQHRGGTVVQNQPMATRRTAARPLVDRRTLPAYAAGETAMPFVITGMNELVDRDTEWEPHPSRWSSSISTDARRAQSLGAPAQPGPRTRWPARSPHERDRNTSRAIAPHSCVAIRSGLNVLMFVVRP